MKYRFKTEKEFEREFGKNWRNICYWNKGKEMDYLFNTDISPEDVKKGAFSVPKKGSTPGFWFVSQCMYTKKEVFKNGVKKIKNGLL